MHTQNTKIDMTLHYGATGGPDTTPVCESSGRREPRPCRVPSLYIAVCPLALHALSRYPFRFPVQVTRCVFSRCMNAAVKTSSSSGPTSALRAALRSYRVVWMVMISGDILTVPEKSCIIVFICEFSLLCYWLLASQVRPQSKLTAVCSSHSNDLRHDAGKIGFHDTPVQGVARPFETRSMTLIRRLRSRGIEWFRRPGFLLHYQAPCVPWRSQPAVGSLDDTDGNEQSDNA